MRKKKAATWEGRNVPRKAHWRSVEKDEKGRPILERVHWLA